MHDKTRMSEFNRRQYEQVWDDLNQELKAIETNDGLPRALEALRVQQHDQGFVRDDLESVERYRFHHPGHFDRFFSVQYNPIRLQRFKGLGRTTSPPGLTPMYDGCFLCRDNIRWQQYGIEMGYELQVGTTPYIVWMNAYPLMPIHAVIAAKNHVPQAWSFHEDHTERFDIAKILGDLIDLSGKLPGYIGFYNGEGAGASIPGHFHYQFFKRLAPDMRFPLELAPKKASNSYATIEDFPVTAVHWWGKAEAVLQQATAWARDWIARNQERSSQLSANIVACVDETLDQTELYLVPRDQMRSHSQEMSGLIGGLEILGELVFSSEDEKHRLDRGEIDYHAVQRILAGVRTELNHS